MHSQSSLHETKYPIPDDCLPKVRLTSEQLALFRRQAADALANAVLEWSEQHTTPDMYLHGQPPWRFHAAYGNLYEYKRHLEPHDVASSVSHIFGSANGDYLDVLRFFQTETRAEYYSTQKKIYGFATDAMILYKVRRASNSALESESIKLVVFDPLSLRFRMGSCHFESLGISSDANGRPFAFRVLVPIDLPEVNELFQSRRTARLRSASVLIISPHAHETSTEIFMTMQNDFSGTRIPRRFYTRFLRQLQEIFNFPLARREYILSQSKWTRARHRSDCSLCARVFSLLRFRRFCSRCRQAVCSRCITKSARLPQVNSSRRICTQCVVSLDTGGEVDSIRHRGGSQAYLLRLSETPSTHVSWSSQWGPLSTDLETSSSSITWTNLSSGSSTSVGGRISETLPLADLDSTRHSNYLGRGGIITEEEGQPSSSRSVELSFDTSEMMRSGYGADRIESIQVALQEQENLLRQLLHASRVA